MRRVRRNSYNNYGLSPAASNRTAKINMAFAEFTEPAGAGLAGGLRECGPTPETNPGGPGKPLRQVPVLRTGQTRAAVASLIGSLP